MSAPEKKGLNYFNIDCFQKDDIEFLIAKFRMEGYGTLVQLWRKIYSIDGYYCDWKQKNMYLFAKDNNIDVEVLKQIIECCFEEEILDKKMFTDFEILTSSGAQKRWLKIAKDAKRKDQKIEPKFCLILPIPEDTAKIPEDTAKIPEDTAKIRVQKEQSKEDKSKEEKSTIITEESTSEITEFQYDDFVDMVNEKRGKRFTKKSEYGRAGFLQLTAHGFTKADFEKVLTNACNDKFYIQKGLVRPDKLCQVETFEKFFNIEPQDSLINEKVITIGRNPDIFHPEHKHVKPVSIMELLKQGAGL